MNSRSEKWVEGYLRLVENLYNAVKKLSTHKAMICSIKWARWWDRKGTHQWQLVDGELIRVK